MNLATAGLQHGSGTSGSKGFTERRRNPRFAFTAAALAFDPISATRIDARTADISLNGCYVDTMVPFPTGTNIDLRLSSEGKSFECEARVAFSQVGMGMGLVFVKCQPEQYHVLQQWIVDLKGESLSVHHLDEQGADAVQKHDEKEHQLYVLNELVILLMKKGVLTEEEGHAMLHRLFRQDGML